ncbi:MAG: hypothetical protein QOD99_2852 [Chthoniobacter sp.]|jgi:hypothetical protein|nr:hypothetical protein [Chthoniobacter sp.]
MTLAARAQELRLQPTPFTAYLDFHALAETKSGGRSFPIWLESFEINTEKSNDGDIEKTTFRLRFRRFSGLLDEMMLRVFFEDTQQPVVTAWSELGTRLLPPRQLGSKIGLPTSETLVLAMSSVDYVDIEVPGAGENVRGAFIASLHKTETHSASDFTAPASFADPFGNGPSSTPDSDDAFLFGRVRATLEKDVVPLKPGTASQFDFDLAAVPRIAIVTFEILNADIGAPPQISVNGRELGPATILLPDLADPAYQSTGRDTAFRYHGWLKCQKVVPGFALLAGTNSLTASSQKEDEAVAIRAVEVQLKYENK